MALIRKDVTIKESSTVDINQAIDDAVSWLNTFQTTDTVNLYYSDLFDIRSKRLYRIFSQQMQTYYSLPKSIIVSNGECLDSTSVMSLIEGYANENFATHEELMNVLSGIVTSEDVNNILSNYYTKPLVDAMIDGINLRIDRIHLNMMECCNEEQSLNNLQREQISQIQLKMANLEQVLAAIDPNTLPTIDVAGLVNSALLQSGVSTTLLNQSNVIQALTDALNDVSLDVATLQTNQLQDLSQYVTEEELNNLLQAISPNACMSEFIKRPEFTTLKDVVDNLITQFSLVTAIKNDVDVIKNNQYVSEINFFSELASMENNLKGYVNSIVATIENPHNIIVALQNDVAQIKNNTVNLLPYVEKSYLDSQLTSLQNSINNIVSVDPRIDTLEEQASQLLSVIGNVSTAQDALYELNKNFVTVDYLMSIVNNIKDPSNCMTDEIAQLQNDVEVLNGILSNVPQQQVVDLSGYYNSFQVDSLLLSLQDSINSAILTNAQYTDSLASDKVDTTHFNSVVESLQTLINNKPEYRQDFVYDIIANSDIQSIQLIRDSVDDVNAQISNIEATAVTKSEFGTFLSTYNNKVNSLVTLAQFDSLTDSILTADDVRVIVSQELNDGLSYVNDKLSTLLSKDVVTQAVINQLESKLNGFSNLSATDVKNIVGEVYSKQEIDLNYVSNNSFITYLSNYVDATTLNSRLSALIDVDYLNSTLLNYASKGYVNSKFAEINSRIQVNDELINDVSWIKLLQNQISAKLNELDSLYHGLKQTYEERCKILELIESINVRLRDYELLLEQVNDKYDYLKNIVDTHTNEIAWIKERINGISNGSAYDDTVVKSDISWIKLRISEIQVSINSLTQSLDSLGVRVDAVETTLGNLVVTVTNITNNSNDQYNFILNKLELDYVKKSQITDVINWVNSPQFEDDILSSLLLGFNQ